MRSKFFLLSFLFWMACIFTCKAAEIYPKWVVYYGSDASTQSLLEYSVLVFDGDEHPILQPFLENRSTVLGYLNLVEVEKERFYFDQIQKEGLLLEENEIWKGSYFVDIRDPRWAKFVLEELVPYLLFQRFSGLFLDTIDNAIEMEQTDPKKYQGMMKATADLIKAIRLNYPQIKIMVNRGYEILPMIASDIDMVCAESLYSDYNFELKKYQKVPKKEYLATVKKLNKIREKNPHLQLFSLDYWDPKDPQTIREIYAIQRKAGFIPYVATVDLQRVIPEP